MPQSKWVNQLHQPYFHLRRYLVKAVMKSMSARKLQPIKALFGRDTCAGLLPAFDLHVPDLVPRRDSGTFASVSLPKRGYAIVNSQSLSCCVFFKD